VSEATLTATASTLREPAFILSPMRSYSTVTMAVLAGHPELYGFPELLIFSGRTIGDVLAKLLLRTASGRPDARVTGICRAIAELHEGNQQEEAIGRALTWLMERTGWPTSRLFDHLAELVYPSVPIEKSPDTAINDANLDHCLASYPNARYIHLVRHPVTGQRSIMQQLRYFFPTSSRSALAARAASIWYLTHLRITRALAQVPADRWYRVHGEDILATPEAALPPLLTWLGVASGHEVVARMRRTEEWAYAGTGPTGWLFGGDHKFMLAPSLRSPASQEALSFDPELGMLDEMRARMLRLAEYLGYPGD
jgi:hypothetical protein